MPDTDTDHSMTTSQTEREQAQDIDRREDAAPRERWGQDPWEMRWGC